jgi:GNAT superfamily N-acetyltransferase
MSDQLVIQAFVTNEFATAFWWGENPMRNRGVAEASWMPDGFWYINRVLVKPPELRGKGIGGQLLERLKQELKEKAKATLIVVDPGGYGMDVEKQRRFYLKHGFVMGKPVPPDEIGMAHDVGRMLCHL